MTPSVVLSRPTPCNVPQGYASVAELPAALLDSLFEHPAGERIAHSSEQSGALETIAGLSVAISGPSGFSGSWVSDTFFRPMNNWQHLHTCNTSWSLDTFLCTA